MLRKDLIVQLIDKERERIFELSENWMNKPKTALTKEQQECKEKYKMLGQMYDEIRMLNSPELFEKKIIHNRKVFIGTISDTPDLFMDCKDSKHNSYYINMKIIGCDEETYKDERLLKLSSRAWYDWYWYLRYIVEKEERLKNNQSILIRAIVYDNEIRSMSWYKHYKKSYRE